MRMSSEQRNAHEYNIMQKAKHTSKREKRERRALRGFKRKFEALGALSSPQDSFFYNSFEMNVNISNTRWPCNV